ncbi:gamma-glutamyltransferase family protein [Desmospora profundinema]|uniref:Gamma-glutamyltranspeptidase/glutathione hydrolase n=1 Tax=Desmospora profundinema TaxID=1571184 RepID=A0ABU1ILR0_9BACL|nr:gamma-glutamyltransferase family protein [Desmospora profundinema]MDR6224725.1 gamma-glutamyltranspeptidase/glutathione hydrolase [Desmospora profundinema]
MDWSQTHYPYPSQRRTVYAKNGVVATSQPLAAEAGLEVLRKGGNAVDAAVATAAALTVLEPTSNGIGGDAFALVWTGGNLYGLNASGPAPAALTPDLLKEAGRETMPAYGWLPVTVPGAPAAWAALVERWGKLPLTAVLEPAIRYAEEGYPLSPVLATFWSRAVRTAEQRWEGDWYREWFRVFAPEGRAPRAGEMWRSPGHGRTLRLIAETGAESFYRGELAERIDTYARATGGVLRAEDLADYRPEWVDPIHVSYRGHEVWEIPPNGQGLVTLLALQLLEEKGFAGRERIDTYHRQMEAIKLAFAIGRETITDPRKMEWTVEELLSDAFALKQRDRLGEEAREYRGVKPDVGGTVYLAAADGEGNMVSFIQSNYMGFGSGIVVPGTGIALQNRGHTFSLEPDHVNVLEPGKRTYHTIIPGFLTRGGEAVGPFGVMGGFMQPQGHLQVVSNLVDFHLNPQSALDAPRWCWTEGKTIQVEQGVPGWIVQGLLDRGHDIRVAPDAGLFGRGQMILRNEAGVLAAGTEPRTDGSAAAY